MSKFELNPEKYSDLSGAEQMSESKKEIARMRTMLEQYEREVTINAAKKLSAEADERDPNRVKHKFTDEDADGVLFELGMRGIHISPSGSHLSGDAALDAHAETTDKHPDWIKTIKYRNYYGEQLRTGIARQGFSEQPEVQQYYHSLNIERVDFSKTVNGVLDDIQKAKFEEMERSYMLQRIAELEDAVARFEQDFVSAIDITNERLASVESFVDMHWKDRVIHLKAKNPKMTQKELAEEVGMSLPSVKKHMQLTETKAAIAKLQDMS